MYVKRNKRPLVFIHFGNCSDLYLLVAKKYTKVPRDQVELLNVYSYTNLIHITCQVFLCAVLSNAFAF